jgi:hypothetical protein
MSKIITGRFGDSIRGPASYGNLTFALNSEPEDDMDNVLPRAAVTEEEKEEFRWSHKSYGFTLDSDGRIPPGTEILGNDELTGNTVYDVTVSTGLRACDYYYRQSLKITGPGPIDINAIIPEGFVPEPEPEPVKPPRFVAPRKPGSTANHVGFFGVTISYPPGTKSISVPSLEQQVFGVCAFTLPFRAVVGCASIIVDSAAQGADNKLIVGLYDASGKRVCATAVDVCNGMATGEFETPVNLPAGDYHLAWGVARHSTTLQIRCIDVDRDQIHLVNAGGGATVFGFGKIRSGDSLPEKLELDGVPRAPIPPPLVYFKG